MPSAVNNDLMEVRVNELQWEGGISHPQGHMASAKRSTAPWRSHVTQAERAKGHDPHWREGCEYLPVSRSTQDPLQRNTL